MIRFFDHQIQMLKLMEKKLFSIFQIFCCFMCFSLLEESYVMKDPFSSEGSMITLGSHCQLCSKSVCAAPVSFHYVN